jgi:hypothetical protein
MGYSFAPIIGSVIAPRFGVKHLLYSVTTNATGLEPKLETARMVKLLISSANRSDETLQGRVEESYVGWLEQLSSFSGKRSADMQGRESGNPLAYPDHALASSKAGRPPQVRKPELRKPGEGSGPDARRVASPRSLLARSLARRTQLLCFLGRFLLGGSVGLG